MVAAAVQPQVAPVMLSPTEGLIFIGLFGTIVLGAIGLGFYQTYAMIQNPVALQTVAKGEAVALGAEGVGEGFAAMNGQGRRKTKKGKRRGRKTYRKTK
jgi:hypothetical protein